MAMSPTEKQEQTVQEIEVIDKQGQCNEIMLQGANGGKVWA